MNKRILSVILASLLTAGLVGTVTFAQNDNGRAIVLPEISFTDTTTVKNEPEVPVEPEYAKAIVFKADSGYTASTYTGYVGGVELKTGVQKFRESLENTKGIEVMRDTETGRIVVTEDIIKHGDKLVLSAEDKSVITELEFIFMGNADRNTVINLTDVSSMLKKIAGWNIEIDEVAADVDGSGNVNITDVSTVLKKIAGWDVKFTNTPVLPGKYIMVNKSNVPCYGTPVTGEKMPLCLSDGIHYDLGVKFNVAEGEFATSIDFECPSWADDKGRITISVYKWNGDYNTSIVAMPIISETFVDYKDNATLVLDLTDTSGKGLVEGEYVWRIHDGSDAGEGTGVGIWYYSEPAPAESTGMKTFLNCEEFNIGPVANIYYATVK